MPKEIPYVYLTQICLQAISGLARLNMTDEMTMWFIRWSPIGFSEFKIGFKPLIKMGILSAILYILLKRRIKSVQDLPLCYTSIEEAIVKEMHKYYQEIMETMQHRYVDHSNLYPEFKIYKQITENFKFRVDA